MNRPLMYVVVGAVSLGLAASAVARAAAGDDDAPTDYSPVVVTPSSTPTSTPTPTPTPSQRSGEDEGDDDDGFSKVNPKPRSIGDDDDDDDDDDDGGGDDDDGAGDD